MDDDLRYFHIQVFDYRIHVTETGDRDQPPVLFVHGWPESSRTWKDVMAAAAPNAHAVAIDLPGIGGSIGPADPATKVALAEVLHEFIGKLDLPDLTLVGHDIGGIVTYAYLRQYPDTLACAVIMDTVVPGVDPWTEVLHNPYLWHFSLHNVPDLPEILVQGRQKPYFDYFYNVLSADPSRITAESRATQAAAYASDVSLSAGFDFYRAFPEDAKNNAAFADGPPVDTPLLYLRGEKEGGDIDAYEAGFHKAGVTNLTTAIVTGTGHFAQEEAPEEVWRLIHEFSMKQGRGSRAN